MIPHSPHLDPDAKDLGNAQCKPEQVVGGPPCGTNGYPSSKDRSLCFDRNHTVAYHTAAPFLVLFVQRWNSTLPKAVGPCI